MAVAEKGKQKKSSLYPLNSRTEQAVTWSGASYMSPVFIVASDGPNVSRIENSAPNLRLEKVEVLAKIF